MLIVGDKNSVGREYREKMIPVAEPLLGDKEIEYITECIKSGWISLGEFRTRFEDEFSGYCNRKHGMSTCNGTVALHLALKTLGIQAGDEVLVPSLTFISVANSVSYCNAKPVFIESHPGYWCLDPEKIEEKITDKTKAIIPVHLYGHPCDMDPVLEIADKHGLHVIEDAAEAHGAEYKGDKVGQFGDISCFSFYGNKTITTGEGGMLLTDNEELAEKAKFLGEHAMSKRRHYYHEAIGFNYRLTNIQAAVGLAQLERIEEFIEIKRRNAKTYNSLLEDSKGIGLPPEEQWVKNIYWMYSILVDDSEGLMQKLKQNGIETRPFFYPLHKQPPYENKESLPVAENLADRGINLPSSVKLKEEQIERITDIINGYKTRN